MYGCPHPPPITCTAAAVGPRTPHEKRVAELESLGIKVGRGYGVQGSITLYAGQFEKLLKLIRRLKRQAEKHAKT